MASKSGGHRVLGAAILGFGILTTMASVIFGAPGLAAIGLAAFLIGLLTLYLPSQPSVSPELVEAYALSSLGNVERFLRELASDTKATYLAVKDRSDPLRVFIPVDDNSTSHPPEQPDHDLLIALNSSDPHRTGLFLDAPGASLLALMEKESGLDFFDVTRADVEYVLRVALVESLEIVGDVKCYFSGGGMRVRIREGDVKIGRAVVRSAPKTTARLGCPTCSAAICAIVKETKRHVVVENVSHKGRNHDVTLTFVGGDEDATR